MGAEKKGSTADAHGSSAPATETRRAVEQSVDLLNTNLDRYELGAALDNESRAEPVALVHLEGKSAQVTESLLTHLEERLALPLQLSHRWNDVPRPWKTGRLQAAHAFRSRHDRTLDERSHGIAHRSWSTTNRCSVISRTA